MQWLTLVSEDAGVQRLKADNRLPATTPGVDAVSPYPAAHPARIEGRPQQAPRAPARDRRRDDRRQGERRRQQLPVVFDTRSRHDRRALENRRKNAPGSTAPAPTGVDLYA